MALHVGHNCNPWADCDVCGAKVEPQYRHRESKGKEAMTYPDPLEAAFLRLRHAADADEYVPMERVIDTVLARLAALRAENERLREALADIREWAKRDDFIRFDDGDIPLADYCARALHGGK